MTDLEEAISRLENAAATWFNQSLHRDLQTLIAAARRKKDAEYPRSAIEASSIEALERRIRTRGYEDETR